MSLINLQAELQAFLLSDDLTSDLFHCAENVSIYRNNMSSTLINVLKETYPLLTKLLGEDFFCQIAQHYIEKYPSRSGNLHDYGEYVSDFLSEHPLVMHLLYLPEVARFEWLCHSLYSVGESETLNLVDLENILPEQYESLHFQLNSTCQLATFTFPILNIIDLCEGKMDETLTLEPNKNYLLIQRRDFEIKVLALSKADYLFLQFLQNDYSISEALTEVQKDCLDFQLETQLPMWIKDRIIVSFSVG